MICLVVIYIHLLSYDKMKDIFLVQTKNIVIDMKKDFLNDTIDSVFLEIDTLRESRYESYKRNTDVRRRRVEEELGLSEEDFIRFFIERFNEDINSNLWTPFLWNKQTGEVIYDPYEHYAISIDNTKESLKDLLSSYVVLEKGNIEAIFGVSKEYIDNAIKNEMGDLIRRRQFSNDSHIWVNELLDYEGGENYAIRRIYPTQIDTEGEYLSTDMEDFKGNRPYLEELESISESGEAFYTYYITEPDSDRISEKIVYAKLYKDYNWIVAMGVPLTDIDAYTESINDEILSLTSELVIRLLGYILLALLAGFLLIYLIDKRRLSSSTKSLEREISMDVLTNAFSRRYGMKILNSYYRRYRQTGESPAIMMFDIDNFKSINDTYGHNIGDIVLVEIVSIIKGFIRSSDQIIRWGGDEFIGIFPGLKMEHAKGYGEKILDLVSQSRIGDMEDNFRVTISIGFSCFSDKDRDYNDVLERADNALYRSKELKNKVTLTV